MSETTMRATFEAYFSDNGDYPNAVERVVTKYGLGHYKLAQTESAWGIWEEAWREGQSDARRNFSPSSTKGS